MSEEQKNKSEAPKEGNGQQRKNRHRNRRGHKKPVQNPAEVLTEKTGEKKVQPAKKEATPPSEKDNDKQNPNGGQKKNRNRHRNHKNRPANGGFQERAVTDPYGIPSPQDQKVLDELRAKIVLKAADGSIPAEVQKKQKAETPVVAVQKTTEIMSVPAEELTSDFLFSDPSQNLGIPGSDETVEVVGVRFRSTGKIYYFDPCGKKMHFGDPVIVETARGIEFGEVTVGNRNLPKSETVSPLRPVIRIATEEDICQNRENRKNEAEALTICQKKIEEHKLEMHLVDAQYAFDRSKLIFYFTSESRVDFRELVRDLAGIFHTRIDLHQIGIRDEAKMLGGLGTCGRPLCCSSFLSDFTQVTIKMAKEQGLSLNSSKISGVCGRLMCCLRYESDVYAEEIRLTPSLDSIVRTPDGTGKVIGTNPLAGTVRVLVNDGQDNLQKVYAREEVVVLEKGKKNVESKKNAED